MADNRKQRQAAELFSELKRKEIVRLADGKRLGRADDVEIDLERQCITALILARDDGRIRFFGQREERIIPWEIIEKIGEDVILVGGASERGKEVRG